MHAFEQHSDLKTWQDTVSDRANLRRQMPYPSYVHYTVILEIEGADEFQQPLSKQHGSGLSVSRIVILVHAQGYLLKVGS